MTNNDHVDHVYHIKIKGDKGNNNKIMHDPNHLILVCWFINNPILNSIFKSSFTCFSFYQLSFENIPSNKKIVYAIISPDHFKH